jgi:cytochrome c
VSEEVGLIHNGWSGDATPIDVNEDGWIDLYVLNMQGNDEYYENIEGRRFERKSAAVFPESPWGATGVKSVDYNEDSHMDLFITNMHADMWRTKISAWNDGGSGTARQGAAIYAQKCALCHGENGVKPAPGFLPMVGPSKFDRIDTMKTVPYYKYATTLFDVMRRSMPFPMPKTLTSDELYALSAYILALNKIIGEEEVMDAKSLPQVKMPNRDNFIIWDPDKIGYEPIPVPGPAMR